MRKNLLAAAAAALSLAVPAHATLSVGSTSYTYFQDFDSLATTATGAWANDSTLAGWSLFNGTGAAVNSYLAGDGSANSGSFYSFGGSGSSDRALGGVGSSAAYFGSPASGAIAGWIAVAFTNATGAALGGFTLGFNGEQWRNGGNTSAQPMVLEYGFGATFSSVTGWTAPGGNFDWSSPVVGSTAGPVNGNGAGKVTGLGGTITTPWAAGDTLWVRWVERNDVGNDHGLAIDDLSFSVSAVPEPGMTAMWLAGLATLGVLARRRSA